MGKLTEMTDAQSAVQSFFSGGASKEDSSEEPVIIKSATGEVSAPKISVAEATAILDEEKEFDNALKELKVQVSELFLIIDEFLSTGTSTKLVSIKDKVQFAFQAKSVRSVNRISDYLDGLKYTSRTALMQTSLVYRLAGALTMFKQGKDKARIFAHASDEDDEIALEFVKNLSVPIFNIMVRELDRFDILVGLASRKEAMDRFLEPSAD
jgi:hypothetical protein